MNDMNFTEDAWEALYAAVDSTYFQEEDADLIYAALKRGLRFIPFGEYLKRYIYKKAGLKELYAEVPLKVYQQIIKASFAENNTPRSFEPTTAKMGALSKNWLTQQTVKRKVVFLLGFGLAMSLEDVNTFLTKALREQGINAKDPFEVICWYCYKNGYGYLKFEKLWEIFNETEADLLDMGLIYSEATVGARNEMNTIHSDAALMTFLSKLKTSDNHIKLSVTARRHFDSLYDEARDLIADLYNETEDERQSQIVLEYQQKLSGNDRLFDYEKKQMLKKSAVIGKNIREMIFRRAIWNM